MTPENRKKSNYIPTKDSECLFASLVIGDGCLSDTGRMVIAHGKPQQDYCEWKAELISEHLKLDIKALPTRQCYQVQFQRKFFKDIKNKWYNDRQKNIPEILKSITNYKRAIAIWLMDDGNVCPSITNGKCYSESFQIFTFTDLDDTMKICDWFEKNINIRPKAHFRDRSKQKKKSAYILKFSAEQTRQLFKLIKDEIPNIRSMNYKFRYLFRKQDRI